MQTHYDNNHKNQFLEALRERADKAEKASASVITAGEQGEQELGSWKASNGVHCRHMPDDPQGILRLSIGGGEHNDELRGSSRKDWTVHRVAREGTCRTARVPRMKCIAFDCFGTVFDMSGVPREEIVAYVAHVRKNDFAPYMFPDSWFDLKAHSDSAEGIRRLRAAGFKCVALSNGDAKLLSAASQKNGIEWDAIINLPFYEVYKPHVDAYRTVEKATGFKPSETLMVTANPTFGDIEGSAAIGMASQVIRHGYPNTIIEIHELLTTTNQEAGE